VSTAPIPALASTPASPTACPPDHLRFVPWPDAVIEQLGHDPRSAYVERFWLPVVGPSATWLARRISVRMEAAPEGFTAHLGDLAREIGLGTKGGRHSPILHTVDRLAGFGIAQRVRADTLAVRRRLPPLTRTQVARLPTGLRQAHDQWIEAQAARRSAPVVPHPADVRERARRLALSLAEMGEDQDSIERQLHRWRFHPAIAYESASWAWSRHHHPAGSTLPPDDAAS
jgi:hypothetical protein